MNHTHSLENNTSERSRFEGFTNTNARAEYRRVVAKLTGGLPTWAERKQPGRKAKAVPTKQE